MVGIRVLRLKMKMNWVLKVLREEREECRRAYERTDELEGNGVGLSNWGID